MSPETREAIVMQVRDQDGWVRLYKAMVSRDIDEVVFPLLRAFDRDRERREWAHETFGRWPRSWFEVR